MPRRVLRTPWGKHVEIGADLPIGCLIALALALVAIVIISALIGLRNEAQPASQGNVRVVYDGGPRPPGMVVVSTRSGGEIR